MPTAAVLGIGEHGLLRQMDAPVTGPDLVTLLGARDPDEGPAVGHIVDELRLAVVAPDAITADPSATARAAVDRSGASGSFWLHLDVDVFGQEEFPATDYLMPGGLSVETGLALVQALAADERMVGFSIGCYNPEKDESLEHGRRLVDIIAAVHEG